MSRYSKTAAGEAEILNKTLSLNFIERSTLLMVNGKRTAADITQSLGSLGNIDDTITKLVTLSLVQAEEATPKSTAPQNYLESIYACRAAATLMIRRSLEPVLGQNADMFMLKLESANDKSMFSSAVENALMAFGNARGAEAKQALAQQLQILPLTLKKL